MTDELPDGWTCERTDSYRPTPNGSDRRFTTYTHESVDVSLRVAPATLDPTERPGYALSVTYETADGERQDVLRTATTGRSCDRLAREFMDAFSGYVDHGDELVEAVTHATDRVKPSAAFDAPAPTVE